MLFTLNRAGRPLDPLPVIYAAGLLHPADRAAALGADAPRVLHAAGGWAGTQQGLLHALTTRCRLHMAGCQRCMADPSPPLSPPCSCCR